MSRTVAMVYGTQNLVGTYLGYEVELEGVNLDCDHEDLYTDLVQCVHDGSLRNGGAEFIFKEPLLWNSDEFAQALLDIHTFGSEYDACTSHRTSTHVHLNVSDLDADQLKRVLYLSLCLEPVLMKYCSVYRQHNRFCLPSYKSTDFIRNTQLGLRGLQSGDLYSRDYFEHRTKYSAISLHRLPSLGTVEFRMFDGTYDKDKLKSIGKIVSTIRRIALNRTISDIQTAKLQGTLYDILGTEISETFDYVSSTEFTELFEKGVTQANDLTLDFQDIFAAVLAKRKEYENIRTKLEQRSDSESNQREDQPTEGETSQQDTEVRVETTEQQRVNLEPRMQTTTRSRTRSSARSSFAEPPVGGVPRGEQINISASGSRAQPVQPRSPMDNRPDPSATVDSGEPVEGGSEGDPWWS